MKGLRQVVHAAMRLKAQRRGVTVGEGVYLAPNGRYLTASQARIRLGDHANLFHDHRLEARTGAEIEIGAQTHFDEGARVLAAEGARIQIGRNCWFNGNVSLTARQEIVVGDNCLFGPGCYLIDNNHRMERGRLIMEQDFDTEPVIVGADVWLGVAVTLLKGARVGDGAVIAAHAVVNRPVPAYEIWGGVPAKKIGERQ